MTATDPPARATYDAVHAAGGFFRDERRGLIEVTGADRQTWLHNLVTNVVVSLKPGDGNYAFAINVKGRTLFDLNILAMQDRLWLDIDRRWIDEAARHLDKYHIVEDVELKDVTGDCARFDVLGPETAGVVAALGLGHNFDVLADVQHVGGEFDGIPVTLVKDNVGPVPRATLFAPATAAADFLKALEQRAGAAGMSPIDPGTFEVVRIEAGRPQSVDDIDDEVIPPETLQIERGISYVKGCYLGQEVLERMRSRGSMARKLVGLKISGDRLPPRHAPLFADGKEIGRITSSCHSLALDSIMALGYAKVLLAGRQASLQVAISEAEAAEAEWVEIPLSAWRR